MPRSPRYTPPGTVQHFISRIAGGEFRIQGGSERAELTRRLAASIGRTDWTPLAFTWMSNHEHLVALAGEQPCERLFKPLHEGFAAWLNHRDGRFGHLYAGRPRNVTFHTEEAIAVLIAYVHNNPVRAGVVTDPIDSGWSTHRAYVGVEPAPAWLDTELGLSLSGFSSSGNGRANFHDFVRGRAELPRNSAMTGDDLQALQCRIRAAVGAPVELSATVSQAPGATILLRRGGLTDPIGLCEPSELLTAVCDAMSVSIESLRSRARTTPIVAARRLALLVWARFWRRPAAQLAPALGITPQACSNLLRDCPATVSACEFAEQLATRLAGSRSGET